MSYILEALKKAEAQRGRGDVPGLDAQHMPAEPLALQPPAGGHGLLIGIIMVLGLAVIGLLLWSGQGADPSAPSVNTPTAGPPTAGPPSAAPVKPPVAAPAPAPAPTAQAPAAPQPPATTAVLVPPPDTRDLPRHFQEAQPAASPERPRAAPVARTADTPLPEDLKAQFPRLSFGGAMHSDNAASRMLIINGQLHREGDTVAPDLVLQRIELKSATFRYKGHTHTVQY